MPLCKRIMDYRLTILKVPKRVGRKMEDHRSFFLCEQSCVFSLIVIDTVRNIENI